NDDGRPDLVVTSAAGGPLTTVALGQADCTFRLSDTLPVGEPVNGPSPPAASAVVADFNGDGRPDLLISIFAGPSQDQQLFLFFGVGDGTFRAGPVPTLPVKTLGGGVKNMPLAAGDFDGDGVTDLIVADATGGAWFLHGNGDGTFRANGDGTFGVLLFSG